MAKKLYTCGQIVVIRRLGDDKEYKARVCGIAYECTINNFYIVEMIDRIAGNDEWTHCVITGACIDEK